MADAVRIGPFPLAVKARGNTEIGRNAGDFGAATREQRARVAAAMSGYCLRCWELPTAIQVQLHRGGRKHWRTHESCRCRAPRRPHRLPPHGPGHPVDVLLVRVGGRPLDEHDGLPIALKAVADEVAAQLWPKDARGQPIGKVDDSASWLRWSYGQRPYRRPRKRTRPGDPPADPVGHGTRLVEIWIAPREDCGARLRERIIDTAEAAGLDDQQLLAFTVLASREDCGCGRSTLPVRWARGEL